MQSDAVFDAFVDLIELKDGVDESTGQVCVVAVRVLQEVREQEGDGLKWLVGAGVHPVVRFRDGIVAYSDEELYERLGVLHRAADKVSMTSI